MSERDDRFAGNNLPRTTGEFRAAPDSSASTAEFRAFVAGQAAQSQPVTDNGSWPEQPWPGESPARSQAKTVGTLVGIVVAVAVIVTVVLLMV